MNREVPNRPNTQEGAVTSFYIKKKRNIQNVRTQDNTQSFTNENTTSIEGLER